MVGGTAFQAYRGFNNEGLSSTSGWIFTALSSGFYAGNIYGSAKSAQVYNQNFWLEIDKDAEDIIPLYLLALSLLSILVSLKLLMRQFNLLKSNSCWVIIPIAYWLMSEQFIFKRILLRKLILSWLMPISKREM